MKVEQKATEQPVVQTPRLASHIDVLDHVLDKGIVIDAHMRIAVGGLQLITIDARVVVASFETYLQHCEGVRGAPVLFDGHQLKSVDDLRKSLGSSHVSAQVDSSHVSAKEGQRGTRRRKRDS
jgi:hypothetical protein